MRLCKDCKSHTTRNNLACAHRSVIDCCVRRAEFKINPVSGRSQLIGSTACLYERGFSDSPALCTSKIADPLCGPNGIYWEARDKRDEPTVAQILKAVLRGVFPRKENTNGSD